MAGMFSGIEAAKAAFAANYLKEGDYIVRIDQVKAGESRKKEAFVAIECTVCHVFDDADGKGHKLGENASQMLMTKNDSFLGNLKAFVASVMDCDVSEVTESGCNDIVSDANPLGGLFARYFGKLVTTRKGNPFTQISWKGPVTPEQLKGFMSPDAIKRIFPNGDLDKVVAEAPKAK